MLFGGKSQEGEHNSSASLLGNLASRLIMLRWHKIPPAFPACPHSFVEGTGGKELYYQNKIKSCFHLYLGESLHSMERLEKAGESTGSSQPRV